MVSLSDDSVLLVLLTEDQKTEESLGNLKDVPLGAKVEARGKLLAIASMRHSTPDRPAQLPQSSLSLTCERWWSCCERSSLGGRGQVHTAAAWTSVPPAPTRAES
ncbi:Nck-Associated Protein 5 [Manis pentadactyla]|nr:Nck-Associated Protein 5 [Manis pentadactyla]